ncbi:uncharacterized protein J3R85_020960 [Psidium guajava]|nr:uncharacterized protein J3R85_020960 [Psidium guajava]
MASSLPIVVVDTIWRSSMIAHLKMRRNYSICTSHL